MDFRLHNRFDIEIIDAKTGDVKQKAFAENVILNQWWTVLENNYAPFFNLAFGSGSGVPSVNDTALFHYEATLTLNNDTGYNDSNNGYAWYRKYVRLTEQQQVGKTFSEIGLVNTNGVLTTHAMLQDMNGNPVTIEKTDTDIFNIYATVYAHWNNNTKHRFFWRGNSDINPFVNWALGRQAPPNGFQVGLGKGITGVMYSKGTYNYPCNFTITFDTTNKRITYDGSNQRIPVGEGNARGFGSIRITPTGDSRNGIVFKAEDFYDGDDIVGEAVGTGDGETTRFNTKMDMPENAKVYVNGIQKLSGVTVRKCGAYSSYPGYYISLIRHESTANLIMYDGGVYRETMNGRVVIYAESDDFNGVVFENGNYVVGFEKARLITRYVGGAFYHTHLYGSNDLSNWNLIYETPDYIPSSPSSDSYNEYTYMFSANERHYKYFKVERDGERSIWGTSSHVYYDFSFYVTDDDCKQIIFDTAPAEGDVITIDYHTPWIAKDADHVLDLGTFTLAYGAYSE